MKYNAQNAKIASITDKILIVCIDIESENHFVCTFDRRNYEYTRKLLALKFILTRLLHPKLIEFKEGLLSGALILIENLNLTTD